MPTKDFQNGLIVGLTAGSIQNNVYTDFGDTITDDWDKIIANATAGTVSNYSVGDTKTLEFVYNGVPYAARCRIIGKNHDTISGTQNTASLTFCFEDLLFYEKINNSTSTNAGGWMGENGDVYSTSLDKTNGVLIHGTDLRKWVNKLLDYMPTNIQNAVKIVDKKYDDSNGLQTAKETMFILSSEEAGGTRDSGSIVAGQGTLYEYFDSDSKRVKNTIYGSSAVWWLRSRNSASGAVGFYSVKANGTQTAYKANVSYYIVPCFCL